MKKIKILGAVLFAEAIGSDIYAFGTGDNAPNKLQPHLLINSLPLKRQNGKEADSLNFYRLKKLLQKFI